MPGHVDVESTEELAVALPGLRAVRWSTSALHHGVKDYYAVGRVERGGAKWWGSGQIWESRVGHVIVKQEGDVHRDLERFGPTTFLFVMLPTRDVMEAKEAGQAPVTAQLEAADPRATPIHRLLEAVDAGADRLALDVAVAEVAATFSSIRTLGRDRTRPVRRAMEYLRDRVAEGVTLDELAAVAELDKFHLCRAFRAQIGMPPHAYLTHLRISRAKELLRRGTRPSEVAPLVGIYDQAQLTRHFRRIVGTTPGRFGKEHATPGLAW